MESSSYLHSDLIFEILSRTSSDALGRSVLASKEWNQTSYGSKFKKIRSQKINIVDGFFVVQELFGEIYVTSFASLSDETHNISLKFVPGFDVRVLAVSANGGIILCTSYNPRQYRVPRLFVCKPLAKLSQQIPNPRTRFYTQGVAMSIVCSNPLRYKILRISSPKALVKNCQLILEVFDSGAWQWKRLKDILLPYPVPYFGRFFSETTVVEARGAFYWMLCTDLIFSFDIEKEEWKIISLPIVEGDCRLIDMAKYEGKLALMFMDRDREDHMQTWVLESHINMVWEKRFVINMKVPGCKYLTYCPLAFYGSDIVVVRGYGSLKYYDFNNEKILKESKLEIRYYPRHIFPFCSDSEPCCLRQGRVDVGGAEE